LLRSASHLFYPLRKSFRTSIDVVTGAIFLVACVFAAPLAVAADPRVEIKTNQGTIVLELYPEKAPKTVANFLQYVKDGYYNGTVFHRVIDGFMIQGGGFDRELRPRPTRAPVENEAGGAAKAGLKNDFGTVAMARTADPHSATAQFFINVKDNAFLNHREPTPQGYGYTAFGKVVAGEDVVRKIAKVATSDAGAHQNVPREPVIITSASVLPSK
jgi:cyclophilin family peptidyl-prolyl cis-trans isomerase